MSKRIGMTGIRPVGTWEVVSDSLMDSRTRFSVTMKSRGPLAPAAAGPLRTQGKADDVAVTETMSLVMTSGWSAADEVSAEGPSGLRRSAAAPERAARFQSGAHRFESSGGNLFPPQVVGIDRLLAVGARINVRSLYQFLDIEGNRLDKLSVIDNGLAATSGFWVYQGRRLDSGRWYTFGSSQLKDLFFSAGLSPGVDKVQIRASDTDGVESRWSEAATVDVTTALANRRPPVARVNPIKTVSDETIDAGRFISASDPDGYAITQYRVRVVGAGRLSLAGVNLGNGVWRTILASDLADLVYEAPSFPSGTRSASLEVQAYDGKFWSSISRGAVTVAANRLAPVAHAVDVTVARDGQAAGHEFFGFSDTDRNTLKRFAFIDDGAAGGFFTVNGVQQAAGAWFEVAAADLNRVAYVGAAAASSEGFRVRVFDGRYWSVASAATVSTVAKPVVSIKGDSGSNVFAINAFDELTGNDLFQMTDAGPAPTKFEIIDLNTSAASGRFTLNGQQLESGVIHTVTASALNSLVFGGGTALNRSLDDFRVRAFNGTTWSDWVSGAVHTEPNMTRSLMQLGSWSPVLGQGVTITYSFLNRVPGYYADDAQERENFIPTNQLMRDAFRRALEAFSAVSGLRFVEVSNEVGGVIRLGTADLGDEGILGWAYAPGALLNSTLNGDIWINNTSVLAGTPDDPFENQDDGSLGFMTLVHELGHAVGLSHPFDMFHRLPPATDNRVFTVMSYASPLSGLEPSTPQLYDIAAIQQLYGRNMVLTAGDDVYRFTPNEPVIQTIWDAGGVDTLDFSNQNINVSADLRNGRFSGFADEDFAINIAYGTVIENLNGGRGNDVLGGNYVANRIAGGVGNDTIRGWGGNDLLFGGSGNDTYIYGLGDGFDVIDEANSGGSDTVRFDLVGMVDRTAGEEVLRENFIAKRVGLDLHLLMQPVGSDRLGSVVIRNMGVEASRIEKLQMFNGLLKIGRDIDLASLYLQASDTYRRFAVTNFSSSNGQIVTPV